MNLAKMQNWFWVFLAKNHADVGGSDADEELRHLRRSRLPHLGRSGPRGAAASAPAMSHSGNIKTTPRNQRSGYE